MTGEKKYRVLYRCGDCKKEFYKIRTENTLNRKAPSCPNTKCRKASRIKFKSARDMENLPAPIVGGTPDNPGKAPGIGGSISAKALDRTAEMVMQDYGMTNLKDNLKAGESGAPKLPPAQQQMADNFFGGGNMKKLGRAVAPAVERALSGKALQGAVNPIQQMHSARAKLPVRVVAEHG